MMSSRKRFKEETQQNLTPKYVKDMAIKVLEHNKTIEMFKTMVIVNLKMGNLGLEVQSLNTILTKMEVQKNKDCLGKYRMNKKVVRNTISIWGVGRSRKWKWRNK